MGGCTHHRLVFEDNVFICRHCRSVWSIGENRRTEAADSRDRRTRTASSDRPWSAKRGPFLMSLALPA